MKNKIKINYEMVAKFQTAAAMAIYENSSNVRAFGLLRTVSIESPLNKKL